MAGVLGGRGTAPLHRRAPTGTDAQTTSVKPAGSRAVRRDATHTRLSLHKNLTRAPCTKDAEKVQRRGWRGATLQRVAPGKEGRGECHLSHDDAISVKRPLAPINPGRGTPGDAGGRRAISAFQGFAGLSQRHTPQQDAHGEQSCGPMATRGRGRSRERGRRAGAGRAGPAPCLVAAGRGPASRPRSPSMSRLTLFHAKRRARGLEPPSLAAHAREPHVRRQPGGHVGVDDGGAA